MCTHPGLDRSAAHSSGRTDRHRPSSRSSSRRPIRKTRAAGVPRAPPTPQCNGLVVIGQHREHEPVRRDPKRPGHELPREPDGLALKIIAEAEVAEHLEERMVPGGRADVFEVVVLAADAHALLRGRRPRVRPLLDAEEHVLELHHPGVREQERRIAGRHERRARHAGVSLGLEVAEERLADLVRAGPPGASGRAVTKRRPRPRAPARAPARPRRSRRRAPRRPDRSARA